MTLQEVFTKAVIGFRKQLYLRSMEPSGTGGCNYRGLHGRACLIGLVVPDEAYKPKWDYSMEGGGDFESCYDSFPEFRALFDPSEGTHAFMALQKIHDVATTKDDETWDHRRDHYEACFASFAIDYNLTYPEIDHVQA